MQKEQGKKSILSFIKGNGSYVNMKEIKSHNYRPEEIKRLVDEGVLEKIKPGLYRFSAIDEPLNTSVDFIDVSKAVPNGIICLASALSHYDLTTYIPPRVDVAIPNKSRSPKILTPPIHTYFFRERYYMPGINEISTIYGPVRIYCIEKTLCDVFRYRKKLGEDMAIEGLKNYLNLKSANLVVLKKFSEICNVKTVMKPYIKSLVGI